MFNKKINLLKEIMEDNGLDGIIISKRTNFLWLTDGKSNNVIRDEDFSLVYLFITKGGERFLITTSSDSDRLIEEELYELDFKVKEYKWFSESYKDAIKRTAVKGRIGSDFYDHEYKYIEEDLKSKRVGLTDFEISKAKKLSTEFSGLLTDYCISLIPGKTEIDIALGLELNCLKKRINCPVLMVGSDERIEKYKHPVATDKKVEKFVLIAAVVERKGICISVSRSVYFGKVPRDLNHRHDVVCRLEERLFRNSKAEKPLKEIISDIKDGYKELRHEDEWKNHTLGGVSGYRPREFLAADNSKYKLKINNILAWNPTIRGVKAEDTGLVTDRGLEQLTIDRRWPSKKIECNDFTIYITKILEL
jgi:Xaa-Pro dipeptidase